MSEPEREPLWAALGVTRVDHAGVAVPALEPALEDWLSVPGSYLLRGPGDNVVQRVRYAFVHTPSGVVELLEPMDGSPIAARVASGGGVYHLCFEVASMSRAVDLAAARGGHVVVHPTPDPAFDGRMIAFLMQPGHGLVELVARSPVDRGTLATVRTPSTTTTSLDGGDGREEAGTETLVAGIVAEVLRLATLDDARRCSLGSSEGWDSLAQLQIVTEVEARFDVRLPMDQLDHLGSVEALSAAVERAHA
jgi:acyl carrier protein